MAPGGTEEVRLPMSEDGMAETGGRWRESPTFMFIGTGRSGSSWFFQILQEHPAVFVPPSKGTAFFTRFHDMGLRWYEEFFPQVAGHGLTVVGEVCEEYLASPAALERMHDYRPTMRLICCFRNPYERTLSAWRENAPDQSYNRRLAQYAPLPPSTTRVVCSRM